MEDSRFHSLRQEKRGKKKKPTQDGSGTSRCCRRAGMPSRTLGAALRAQGSQPKGLPAKPRQPGREVEQAEPGKEGDFTTPLAERSADHRRGVDMTGCADVSRARHIDGCSVSSVNSGPVHQGQTGARFSLGKQERRNVGNAESAHLSGSKQALCRDRPSRPRGRTGQPRKAEPACVPRGPRRSSSCGPGWCLPAQGMTLGDGP